MRTRFTALASLALLLLTSVPASAADQLTGASENPMLLSHLSDDDSVSDDDTASSGGTLFEGISGSFNSLDHSVDRSTKLEDAKNVTDSYNLDGNIFARPVAKGHLSGYVSHNYVTAGSEGSKHQSSASTELNATVTLGDSTLSEFAGVNSMNINAGANALQQSNVSISAVTISACCGVAKGGY